MVVIVLTIMLRKHNNKDKSNNTKNVIITNNDDDNYDHHLIMTMILMNINYNNWNSGNGIMMAIMSNIKQIHNKLKQSVIDELERMLSLMKTNILIHQ